MAIDKSLKQHYEMQGGGPNYLGKQKMVKAPKKWQSSPDHEPAELAYITEKEKDILIDLDIYGSLNGKPNRGPSGIISLQGDLGGYSGSGRSSSGGGNDRDPNRGWQTYVAPPPPPVHSPHRDPTPAEQMMAESTRLENVRKAAEAKAAEAISMSPIQRAVEQKKIDEAARVKDILTRGGVEDRIAKYATPEYVEDPETGKLVYNAEAIQKAAAKESRARALGIGDPLTTEEITSLPLGVNISDLAPAQKITTDTKKSFLPTFTKEGVIDYSKQKAKNLALKAGMQELGLTGFLPQTIIPWGISKLFGGEKDPMKEIRKNIAKFQDKDLIGDESKKKLVGPVREGEGAGAIPPTLAEEITGRGLESGQKMLGLDPERIQQIYQGRDLLKQTIESGMYQGRQLNMNEIKMLQNKYNELSEWLNKIEQAQAPIGAAHGGRIDKALGGRNRYI